MLSGALYKATPVHPALKESVGTYKCTNPEGACRFFADCISGRTPMINDEHAGDMHSICRRTGARMGR